MKRVCTPLPPKVGNTARMGTLHGKAVPLLTCLLFVALSHAALGQWNEFDAEKDTCFLGNVALALPRNGTTVLYAPGAADMALPILALTDCLSDTQQAEFLLDDVSIETVTDPPFAVDYSTLGTISLGLHTVLASIKSFSSATLIYKAESQFTLATAATGADSNSNGLPDYPFTTLPGNGFCWISKVDVADTGNARLVGVTRWAGSGGTQNSAPVAISLTDPLDPESRVRVIMPPDLLDPGEVGMLIVIVADDLDTLLGPDEADLMGTEPSRGLVYGGKYVEISVVISTDGGVTIDEIASTRLAAHPIHLAIEGLTILSTDHAYFYSHPTQVEIDSTGLEIVAADGSWNAQPLTNLESDNGIMEADLTSLSVVAPYRTSGEGEGEGEADVTWEVVGLSALLLGFAGALLAIFTHSDTTPAASGGGGGGGPCFIATAAFGTPMCDAIDTLRTFRDVCLLDNAFGTALVDVYYRISPALADMVAVSPALAGVVRGVLWPVILLVRLVLALPPVNAALFAATLTIGTIVTRKRKRSPDKAGKS